MTARTLLALGAILALSASSRGAAADPSASPSAPVRAELMRLLKGDAGARANKAGAARPLGGNGAGAASPPACHRSPLATIGEPFSPALWAYFTDTGILTSEHGKKVTKELTFGPCTDGGLLNRRYYW